MKYTEASPQCGQKIVVTGAAGLVGQNLIPRLRDKGFDILCAIDKHKTNTAILRQLNPGLSVIEADLARDDGWQAALEGADALIACHAQIGGNDPEAYYANNVIASERLLDAARMAGVPYLVQISSSVVNSAAIDHYTESKKAQEKLALECGIPCVVLRPTLMFGWFDRKHLGWLARFMQKVPLFPIPGHGRYLRQPLYAGDFCSIIMSCLDQRIAGQAFNISGLEPINYVDLIRSLQATLPRSAPLLHVPVPLFRAMLGVYGAFSSNPPFTNAQLDALMTPDVFEVIDWPGLFNVQPTALLDGLRETYCNPAYAEIVLDF